MIFYENSNKVTVETDVYICILMQCSCGVQWQWRSIWVLLLLILWWKDGKNILF